MCESMYHGRTPGGEQESWSLETQEASRGRKGQQSQVREVRVPKGAAEPEDNLPTAKKGARTVSESNSEAGIHLRS